MSEPVLVKDGKTFNLSKALINVAEVACNSPLYIVNTTRKLQIKLADHQRAATVC